MCDSFIGLGGTLSAPTLKRASDKPIQKICLAEWPTSPHGRSGSLFLALWKTGFLMADRATSFRQIDVTRALRAVRAAGFDGARIELEPGKMVIITGGAAVSMSSNTFDEILGSGM